MQKVTERMARVGEVADRVGLRVLAREAGVPVSTVQSYAARGWTHKHLPACDKLIAAADRLDRSHPAAAE